MRAEMIMYRGDRSMKEIMDKTSDMDAIIRGYVILGWTIKLYLDWSKIWKEIPLMRWSVSV